MLDSLEQGNPSVVQRPKSAQPGCHLVSRPRLDRDQEGDHGLRLKAISRAEKQLAMESKLLGELNDGASAQVNIQILAPVILEALTPFPEARRAVAGRLQELEARPGG